MATKKARTKVADAQAAAALTSSSIDELLLAALERNDGSLDTGRFLVTFKEGATREGIQSLSAAGGMRVADARDFAGQAATLSGVGDADAVVFPEVGVALLSGAAAAERGMGAHELIASDSPVEVVEPERFVFAQSAAGEYMRGFLRAAEVIAGDLRGVGPAPTAEAAEEDALVMGATWGLNACKVPPSVRSGVGIKVAVLDTGMDLGHPDFAGRPIVTQTFVGQPIQDINGHGTHIIGTACGPKAPAGTIPRYGIAFKSLIFVGKILSNSGSGATGSVLAGMNWAIANRCPVIYAPIGSQSPPSAAYTAAGQAALNNGCLMIAPAGGAGGNTVSAPANSPTIMSVASLEMSLSPSPFSNTGKIEIAAPGRDIFSAAPRPALYRIFSGTSSAGAHVAGCAALWAETSPNLRGILLWRKLRATARPLPFPPTVVGAGLVQAP